jgi:hypothetical protein
MDNASMGYMALVVLFVIFFLVASFFSGQTWRVVHVLIVVGVFMASLAFFGLSAFALKSHQAWRELAQKLEAEFELAKEAHAKSVVALRDVRTDLTQAQRDRGRAWYGNGSLQDNGAQVIIRNPEPANLAPDMYLFAFEYKENERAPNPKRDGRYLGKFKVQAVDNNTVTLASTDTVRPTDPQQLVGRQGYWVLFEVMPIDGHEAMSDLARDELIALFPDANDTAYFANPAEHARLIDDYLRDGADATAEDMQNHPDRVWVEVQITQRDVERQVPDGKGGTELTRLPSGTKVILPKSEADALIADGVAREERKVFRRLLRRYEHAFMSDERQQLALQDAIAEKKKQQQVVDEAQKIVDGRIAARQKERDALAADLKQLNSEGDALQTYRTALDAQEAQIKQRIVATFQENTRLASAIASAQLEAARRIRAGGASFAQP